MVVGGVDDVFSGGGGQHECWMNESKRPVSCAASLLPGQISREKYQPL